MYEYKAEASVQIEIMRSRYKPKQLQTSKGYGTQRHAGERNEDPSWVDVFAETTLKKKRVPNWDDIFVEPKK